MPLLTRSLLTFLIGLSVFMVKTFSVEAQVVVVKDAVGFKGNPKLIFNGISGDPVISNAVKSDLKMCGWFDLVSSGQADYKINGSATGNQAKVSVLEDGGSSFSMSVNYNSSNPRQAAHKIVDAIVKKLFKENGICSTKIAFCAETKSGVKEIYLSEFDGKNYKPLTKSNTLSVEPDWVPGKNNLIYTRYGKSYTYIIEKDLSKKKSRVLTKYPGLNCGGAISPNGRLLALTLSIDGNVELYTKNMNRKGQKRLTRGRSVEASPCWSPDGRMICYVSDVMGKPRLFVVNADGSGFRQIGTKGSEAVSPDWNSKGKIVFAAKKGNSYQLAVTDLSGEASYVTNSAGDWESPSWMPDNRHIICSRTLNGKSALYMVDSFSGKETLLLSTNANLTLPSCSNL